MRIRHIKGAEEYIEQSPFVINEPQSFQGRWKEAVFGNQNPLYLEVGMGMGQFIRTHAQQHPEYNYIGFEINSTVLYKALRRYLELREGAGQPAEPEASNLRFIRQDARFLAEDFGPGEVDRIYLNFSDPWPKARHARRRLTSLEYLARYDEILSPNGQVEFKTDNRALFDFSLEQIEASPVWTLAARTFDLHQDPALNHGNIMTEYEEKFSSMDHPICKLIARRSAK